MATGNSEAYATYDEQWPFYALYDKPEMGAVKIELTEEELAEYKLANHLFWKWQEIIRERAYPKGI